MAGFEEKLRKCYEYDPIEPRDGFLEELKGLESAQKPRRRYLLPIAAAAALALIAGWAWLHAAPPERTPAPGAAPEELVSSPAVREEPVPEETEKPEKNPRTEPNAKTPEEIPPQETDAPAKTGPDHRTDSETTDQAGASHGAQAPTAPRNDVPRADSESDEPENPAPDKPADPVPDEPGKPDEPAEPNADPPTDEPTEPTPEPPDEPAGPAPDDPNPDPPADDPEPPRDSPIGAVYQMSDGRETLTLTLMSTGESVDLDVTGWEGQPEPAPDVPPGPATYSGSNPIVNFIFEKNITYHLTRDDDGAVRVDLDVADTGN